MEQIAQFILDATARITPLLVALMKARTDGEKAILVRQIKACQTDIVAQLRQLEAAQAVIETKFADYEKRQSELDDKLKEVETKAKEPPRWG